VKFVTDLGKGILGGSDSSDLWSEIIRDIPDDVLTDPDTKILNVACGHLTEARLLVKRMMDLGVSAQEANSKIYVLDKYSTFTNAAKMQGYQNVIQTDFLEWKTDMKFDVVLGNPPYQSTEDGSKRKKMWVSFANKAIDMADTVAFVTPTAWQKSNSKYFKDISERIQENLVAYSSTDDYFNVGESTGYWIIDKNSSNTIKYVDDNPCAPIYEKMLRTGDKWHYRDFQQPRSDVDKKVFPDTVNGSFNVPIYWTAKQVRYCRAKDVKHNGWKVIVNNSGHFYQSSNPEKYSTVSKDMTVGLGAWGIKVPNKVAGKRMLSWIQSKLYRVVVTQMKTGGFNNPFVELECLGHDKVWTDKELYKHFKLTKAEIEYIENAVG
jgi:hypothetical protein